MINVCRNYVNSLKVNLILEPVKVVVQGRFWESVKRLFYASVMCRWRKNRSFKLAAFNWLTGGISQPRSCVCVCVFARTNVWRKSGDRPWLHRGGGISRLPFLLFLTYRFALLIFYKGGSTGVNLFDLNGETHWLSRSRFMLKPMTHIPVCV